MHMTAAFGAGGRREELARGRGIALDAEEGDLGRSKKRRGEAGRGGVFEVRCGPVVNYRGSQSRQVWLTQSGSS
jgi:hypothetical protein